VEEVEVKEDPKPTAEELRREREERERIQREREEQERIERERVEQERVEREKREEQERIEREKKQQAEKLDNLGKDAFGNQGVGESEGGQGITEGNGNQGDPDGTPDVNNYETGGGLGNNPDNYGLGSRKAIGSLPKPDLSGCQVTSRIIIKVDIQVDRKGKVTSASIAEASFTDQCINEMVRKAALSSRFTEDPDANFSQKGWIKYTILP
jgi:outer membrane biosynthesis protein TonB